MIKFRLRLFLVLFFAHFFLLTEAMKKCTKDKQIVYLEEIVNTLDEISKRNDIHLDMLTSLNLFCSEFDCSKKLLDLHGSDFQKRSVATLFSRMSECNRKIRSKLWPEIFKKKLSEKLESFKNSENIKDLKRKCKETLLLIEESKCTFPLPENFFEQMKVDFVIPKFSQRLNEILKSQKKIEKGLKK